MFKVNNKKLIGVITLAIMLMLLLMPFSDAIVSPTSDFYVNDYAGLLSNETKQHIMQKNISLESQTGAQIVVVTIPNLEGTALEDYSIELARSFGIGDKNKNNGLLLLLALEEREFRVEVGYGLEGILPDAKTGRFQDDYIIPYLRNNDWDKGVLNGFNAFYQEICNYYEIDVDVNINQPIVQQGSSIIPFIFIVIFIILFCVSPGFRRLVFWMFIFGGSSGGRGHRWSEVDFLAGGRWFWWRTAVLENFKINITKCLQILRFCIAKNRFI